MRARSEAPRSERAAAAVPPSFVDNLGFSIERMPGLTTVLEQFSNAACASVEPLIGATFAATVSEVRSDTLFSVLMQREGDIAAVLNCTELDVRVPICLADDLIELWLCAIFGADSDPADTPRTRKRSRIEMNLIREAASSLGAALEQAFQQTAHAPFGLEKIETVAGTGLLGRRDMPVTVAHLRFASGLGEGEARLILPQSLLQALRYELSKSGASNSPPADPRWARQMEVGVTRASLPITAVLEELEMTLGEIAGLKVGQTIELRGVDKGRVRLHSAGKGIFWGHLDDNGPQFRLVVDEPIDDGAELGEELRRSL